MCRCRFGAAVQLRVRPQGGGHELNNPFWPQFVSTLTRRPATSSRTAAIGPASPLVNFTRGPRKVRSTRRFGYRLAVPGQPCCQNQMMPGNLQNFASESVSVPTPDLPENQRDVRFTVNGRSQPELKLKPGQTEIWSLATSATSPTCCCN